CLMLYSYGDRKIQEFFIESRYPAREIVAEVYNYLRAIDGDLIELTQQEIKEALGLQISAEGVGACEQLLEKAGALERLESRENMARVKVDSDAAMLVDMLPGRPRRSGGWRARSKRSSAPCASSGSKSRRATCKPPPRWIPRLWAEPC